jgi:hypothetical protein
MHARNGDAKHKRNGEKTRRRRKEREDEEEGEEGTLTSRVA